MTTNNNLGSDSIYI